jgi:hypothetical protein
MKVGTAEGGTHGNGAKDARRGGGDVDGRMAGDGGTSGGRAKGARGMTMEMQTITTTKKNEQLFEVEPIFFTPCKPLIFHNKS